MKGSKNVLFLGITAEGETTPRVKDSVMIKFMGDFVFLLNVE